MNGRILSLPRNTVPLEQKKTVNSIDFECHAATFVHTVPLIVLICREIISLISKYCSD